MQKPGVHSPGLRSSVAVGDRVCLDAGGDQIHDRCGHQDKEITVSCYFADWQIAVGNGANHPGNKQEYNPEPVSGEARQAVGGFLPRGPGGQNQEYGCDKTAHLSTSVAENRREF